MTGAAMMPEGLDAAIDAAVPPGVTHIGIVVTDVRGRFLIAEPHGHPYGVSATFSKLRPAAGERPSQTLGRCLAEQVGREVCSVYPVRGVWVTENGAGCYFAGLVRDNAEGVASSGAALRWCEGATARAALAASPSASARSRDLGLLASVERMCLSPYRSVLLMVRELHRLGFERLRAFCYIYALGTWRCEVVPAAWVAREPGASQEPGPRSPAARLDRLLGHRNSIHFYTSAQGQRVFGADDAVFLAPDALARRYLREAPHIAAAGYGPDAEYAAWFGRALDALAPNGVFYASSEDQPPTGYLYTLMSACPSVPLPPPGALDPREWRDFDARVDPP